MQTRWIGQKGVLEAKFWLQYSYYSMQVSEIENSLARLKAQPQVTELKKELNVLRSYGVQKSIWTCWIGGQYSTTDQESSGLILCSSYTHTKSRTINGEATTSNVIGAMWKENCEYQTVADKKLLQF